MAENGKLTKRQKQGLDALLRHGTVRAAAAETMIGERTLYRWCTEVPAFQAELRQHQSAVLDETGRALTGLAMGAVGVYENLLEHYDARVQLRAADSVMSHLIRIRELVDIERRLAELEAVIDAK